MLLELMCVGQVGMDECARGRVDCCRMNMDTIVSGSTDQVHPFLLALDSLAVVMIAIY